MIFLAIPAVALALASLAAFFGRYVWWLDVLANFRLQYLVALIVLGVALLFSRLRNLGFGILFVAAINFALVAPLYLGSPGDSEISAPTIRVMSFNLLSNNEEYGEVVDSSRLTNPTSSSFTRRAFRGKARCSRPISDTTWSGFDLMI